MDFHRVHRENDRINVGCEFSRQVEMKLTICWSNVAPYGGQLWSEANEPQDITFNFASPVGVEAAP